MNSRHVIKQTAIVWLLLLASSTAWAQAGKSSDSMPPWTVLVLKLVSATHVQPTTGIMLAEPDLVLVPLDFARAGDEILVLDGGTDIVRHGRPATIVHTLPADQLAILRVQGLNRPAATLSVTNPASSNTLRLVAFPPAEMIAQGAAPIRAEIKTNAAINSNDPTLDPFANVTGPLTDACGNLFAFNLAIDVQSLTPAASPRLAWADALQRAATAAGASLKTSDCSSPPVVAAKEQAPEPEKPAITPAPPVPEPADPDSADPDPANPESSPLEPRQEPEQLPEDPEVAQPEDEALPEGEEKSGDLLDPEAAIELDPSVAESADQADPVLGDQQVTAADNPRQLSPVAMVVAGLVLLLLLAWWIHRQRSRRGAGHPQTAETDIAQTSDEPRTVRFEPPMESAARVYLHINGELPGGESFSQDLPVNGPEWQAEIGRQDASIKLESPSVSRLHARLELHEGRLTLSDLDSTNGTRINDVPCLPGEVFFIQSSDRLEFGDVQLQIQLQVSDANAS